MNTKVFEELEASFFAIQQQIKLLDEQHRAVLQKITHLGIDPHIYEAKHYEALENERRAIESEKKKTKKNLDQIADQLYQNYLFIRPLVQLNKDIRYYLNTRRVGWIGKIFPVV